MPNIIAKKPGLGKALDIWRRLDYNHSIKRMLFCLVAGAEEKSLWGSQMRASRQNESGRAHDWCGAGLFWRLLLSVNQAME